MEDCCFNCIKAPFEVFKGQMFWKDFQEITLVNQKVFLEGKRSFSFLLKSNNESIDMCNISKNVSIWGLKERFSEFVEQEINPSQDWILEKDCSDFLKLAIGLSGTGDFIAFFYPSLGIVFDREIEQSLLFLPKNKKIFKPIGKPEKRVYLRLFLEKLKDKDFSISLFAKLENHLTSVPWDKGPRGF